MTPEARRPRWLPIGLSLIAVSLLHLAVLEAVAPPMADAPPRDARPAPGAVRLVRLEPASPSATPESAPAGAGSRPETAAGAEADAAAAPRAGHAVQTAIARSSGPSAAGARTRPRRPAAESARSTTRTHEPVAATAPSAGPIAAAAAGDAPADPAAPVSTLPGTAAPDTVMGDQSAPASPAGVATVAGAASGDGNEAPPLYPTLLPPPARLHYLLRRGADSGSAELLWQHDADGYDARLTGGVGPIRLDWHSRGAFDDAGVAPQRFTTRRRSRGTLAVNFQREAGRITYSGPSVEHAIVPGAQDRLSWIVQLAAIARARPPAPGQRVVMVVAGVRGEADLWRFTVVDTSETLADGLVVPYLHLLRQPARPWDLRVEVWLDPARDHWPARLLLSYHEDGRDALELSLRD